MNHKAPHRSGTPDHSLEQIKELIEQGYIHYPNLSFEMNLFVNALFTRHYLRNRYDEYGEEIPPTEKDYTVLGKEVNRRIKIALDLGISKTEKVVLEIFEKVKADRQK